MDNLFMAPTPILWHIAGIGAQGGLLAQHFFHGRHEVQLILKNKAQLTTYQQSTLTLFKENTTFIASPSATTVDDLNHPIHHLICCTKAPDTVPLLMQLAPRLSHRSLIILIQNGIGVLDEIKEKLPQLRIILGISTMGSYLKKPFTVQAGLSGKIHLGRAIGHFSEEEEAIINRTFTLAQLSHQWEHDIYPIMWEKFALNCCINILTALFSCKNGELRYHEESLIKITQEVALVLQRSPDTLLHEVKTLIEKTDNNYSSMYKDMQQHKPTEIHYLNHALIRLAEQKNIATPFNIELVKQLETMRKHAATKMRLHH